MLGVPTWFLSALTVILLPKCPICFAAWIVALTGIAVEEALAQQLGSGILWSAAVLFGLCSVSFVLAFVRRSRAFRVAGL